MLSAQDHARNHDESCYHSIMGCHGALEQGIHHIFSERWLTYLSPLEMLCDGDGVYLSTIKHLGAPPWNPFRARTLVEKGESAALLFARILVCV